MALFKKKEPPVVVPPPPVTCICGTTVAASQLSDHLDSHIVAVTMPGGYQGRSYDCPICGLADEAYGQPGEHPISLRNISQTLFRRHCSEVHQFQF